MVEKDAVSGAFVARKGREKDLDKLRAWVQSNVERLYRLAELH
jgi:hypothetical protein